MFVIGLADFSVISDANTFSINFPRSWNLKQKVKNLNK
jgi:hypothetical protein